jgi:DNA-binding Lrp family transcriptional regulator
MAKTVDNYSAFNELNLSNARGENESFEDYKKRQKQNKEISKVYEVAGREGFKAMFPNGILEAIKNSEEAAEKATTEKLGEAK